MSGTQVKQLLQQHEGLRLEFKEAVSELPATLFETVCAFLNRAGGDILLGVGDDGTILGVNPTRTPQLLKEIVNSSNNPQLLEPPFVLFPQLVEVNSKKLIHIQVPESSQVHKCRRVVYDRSEDGDYKITNHTAVAELYTRKSAFYTENTIYPYLAITDFKPGILNQARQLIRSRDPSHPWLALPDVELLRSAGLYRKDYKTGQEGYTLAAAILFGTDQAIQNILPHYRIDALVRIENPDRYDDRLDIRTNLIDAYDLLMQFIAKHLPDRFYLQGDVRISLRDIIFREVVANLIVHREYTNGAPARLIIYAERVETDNANKPRWYGPINPNGFSPYPKNPDIAKFFLQMGRVDELGSGVRNVTNFLLYYSPGQLAQFIEEDVFRTIIPIPLGVKKDVQGTAHNPLIDKFEKEISQYPVPKIIKERLMYEISLFVDKQTHSATELADLVGVSYRTINRDFKILLDVGILQPSDSFGLYELAERWKSL